MHRHSLALYIFLGVLLAAPVARADIAYGFGTVALSPQGQISGSFTATEAAIADGILVAAELSGNFAFTNATAPFAPATFTPNEFGDIATPYFGEIYVDRVSGGILSGDFIRSATDVETGQGLSITTHNVRVASDGNFTGLETPLIVSGGGPGAVSGGPGGGIGNDITYAFATTLAPAGGPTLTGSFVVPKSAIADGRVTFEETVSMNFTLSGSTNPQENRSYTRDNFSPFFWGPGGVAEIRVHPVTGVIQHDFMLSAYAPANEPGIRIFPHRYDVLSASGPQVGVRGEGRYTVTGGATPAAQVPALHPLVLASLAAGLAAVATTTVRRRRPLRR